MEALCEIEVQPNGVGAVLTPDDLFDLTDGPTRAAELQALLDAHRALHIRPRAPMRREAVGRLAFALGQPRDPQADGGELGFIRDLGAKARAAAGTPRAPSYIERPHYDGISAYSVAATFDASPLRPQVFIDMHGAWQTLPAQLKAVARTGHALHAGVATPRTPYEELPAFDPETARRRPLVVRHARTGAALLHLPRNPASRIEGLGEAEGRALIDALWAHVEASPARFSVTPAHNELVVWDGMAAVHTNPPYPRDRDYMVWFFVIPTKVPALDPAFEPAAA